MPKQVVVFAMWCIGLGVLVSHPVSAKQNAVSRAEVKETPAKFFQYGLTPDRDGIIITRYLGKGIAVVLPSQIDGLPVVEVATKAFYGCVSLVRVSLPSSVRMIGQHAFDGCTKLARIELPDGLREIRHHAFHKCVSLAGIVFPRSLQVIGQDVFSSCGSLVDVVLPNSVKEIGSGAFRDCAELASVRLPVGVKNLADGLFEGCRNLVELGNLPEKVSFGVGV